MPVNAIPEGYHTVTPYLVVRDAARTVDFLKKAFGAEYAFEPMTGPDGKIMHAELKIGDSRVMISDATEHARAWSEEVYTRLIRAKALYDPDNLLRFQHVVGQERRPPGLGQPADSSA